MYHALKTWEDVFLYLRPGVPSCVKCSEPCRFLPKSRYVTDIDHKKFTAIKWGFSDLCQPCHDRRARQAAANAPKSISKEEMLSRIKKTNLERYGVEWSGQVPEVKQKIKDTFEKKYEGGHPWKDPAILAKRAQTNLERYGEVNPSYSQEIKDKISVKIHKALDERYDEIYAKVQKTSLERYGVDHPSQSPIVKAKVKETCQSHFGVDYALQAPEVRKKIKETLLKRYGVDHPSKFKEHIDRSRYHRLKNAGISDDNIDILSDQDKLISAYRRAGSGSQLAKELGTSLSTVSRTLSKYGISIDRSWLRSGPEIALANWIEQLVPSDVIRNDRDLIAPYEIDIYLPEHNLAIEYNGTYWHSELSGNKPRNYHLNKTLSCAKKDIQLLHIFDNEDIELWKSVICSKLGLAEKIFARQCKIVEVDLDTAREFLINNHLQSDARVGKIRLGLVFEGVLMSLMTFNKASKHAKYELVRFCSLRGFSVLGGASRLLKAFQKHNNGSILSYANLRWSNGQLYNSLGFRLLHQSPPNYFYTNDYEVLYGRELFQKHKLESKLDIFKPLDSEWTNMQNNGWDRIWDCGNLVYLLDS